MNYTDTANSARDWAVSKIGCKYSQAKRTQEGIFDCSSLIARAYSAQGKAWKYGGRVPVSCNEVYDDDFELIWPASYDLIGKKFGGSSVIVKAKQPGDIQFLNTMSTGRTNKITHVTMVASASKIVHARSTAYGVRKDSITLYAGKVCALVRYNPGCDLVFGHKGYRTAAMQKALNKNGADLIADGEFGEETLAALKTFQQKVGLPVIGRGDTATRTALGLISNSDGSDAVTPANPMQPVTPVKGIHVTGNTVNIRVGPGTGFDIVKDVKKGAVLTPVDSADWRPVLIGDDVCWISEKYTKLVG